jgi:5-methylthioadenosine/S-adenosylhomocysteine deaminase
VLGPRFLAVHAVWLDDDELDLLATTGTPVSHNAASNLKILGTPRIADMIDRGVVVGIGTDGAPSNNRMSVIDELWLATIVQKGLRRDPTVLPAWRALRMATIDGARALGLGDELGSLEAGKAADVLLVDPLTVSMVPRHDPVSAVITAMRADNVHSVLCAGRWVLRERAVCGVDERAVVAEADARGLAVARRAGIMLG